MSLSKRVTVISQTIGDIGVAYQDTLGVVVKIDQRIRCEKNAVKDIDLKLEELNRRMGELKLAKRKTKIYLSELKVAKGKPVKAVARLGGLYGNLSEFLEEIQALAHEKWKLFDRRNDSMNDDTDDSNMDYEEVST